MRGDVKAAGERGSARGQPPTPAVEAATGWKLPAALTEADGHKLLPLIKYCKTPDDVAVALRQKVVF